MSWSLPQDAYEQPQDERAREDTGDESATFVYKGPFSALDEAAKALDAGDTVETGWAYASHELQRVSGDYGILSIKCYPDPGSDSSGEDKPLKDVWSMRSVRNDVSVMAYCGPNEGVNPNRPMVEAWMKEPDGELASRHKFRDSNGIEVEITSDATLALIAKIEKGIEAVIRFYPVLTRTRTYAKSPPACLENLNTIDEPAGPDADAIAPGNIAEKIDDYTWLKVQDDAIEQADGKWTRIESWMGSADGWDEDLYGENRWPMPYEHNS